jgi:hypothetical protein
MFLLTQTAERNMLNELTAIQAIELGREVQAIMIEKLTESVIARINGVIKLKAENGHTSGDVDVVHHVGVWRHTKGKDTVYCEAQTHEILDYVIENINRHYEELGFDTEFEFVSDDPVTTICWGN